MWLPAVSLAPDEVLAEFDQWVTPTLGDIRDTQRFEEEAELLFDVVGAIATGSEMNAGRAYRAAIELLQTLLAGTDPDREARVAAVVTAMFLVTAKSDNAVKCQFPIWFRAQHGDDYPLVRRSAVISATVPGVIKSVDLVKNVISLSRVDLSVASALLTEYVEFLLSSSRDLPQLEALVGAFASAERARPGSGRDLLAPLVSFQVRGSVAASGGHDPEEIVRRYLTDWGLEPLVHFNRNDVTAAVLSNWLLDNGDDAGGTRQRFVATGDKTRAFDFVLPCFIADATRRVFVQSQFYAGDSGSVSHKNVDQAGVARLAASVLFADARFVELVDGAGYCSSLRNDLKHLLFAADTDDFVQLRSIPVRLRRILQQSGLIAPIDVALRVSEGMVTRSALEDEIQTSTGSRSASSDVDRALNGGWVVEVAGTLSVAPSVTDIVARYSLLDRIIRARRSDAAQPGWVLIPGFGPSIGAPIAPDWDMEILEDLISDGIVMRVIA